jgi:hypothetical protein
MDRNTFEIEHIMYTKHRSYTLAGKGHHHANVMVNPTGYLHIHIMVRIPAIPDTGSGLTGHQLSLAFL